MMLKLSLQAAAIVLTIMTAAMAPVWYFSSNPHNYTLLMLLTGSNCLLMAVLGMIPLISAVNRDRSDKIRACQTATALRLVLTVAGAVVVYFIMQRVQPVDIIHLALWTMGFYLALLVWETITALRIMGEEEN